MKMPQKATERLLIGPVEITYHVCERRTEPQGTSFLFNSLVDHKKKKRLGAVAAPKCSSEAVAGHSRTNEQSWLSRIKPLVR
jgi:hypothetical protein